MPSFINNYVVGLQISVNDVFFMQPLDCKQYLCNNFFRHLLWNLLHIVQELGQVPKLTVLQNKVEELCVLKRVEETNDKRMLDH